MESEVTDFPDPLSPTNANISPFLTWKEMFLTAAVLPLSEIKSTLRFSMRNSGCIWLTYRVYPAL
jgi:hypothetical protein